MGMRFRGTNVLFWEPYYLIYTTLYGIGPNQTTIEKLAVKQGLLH